MLTLFGNLESGNVHKVQMILRRRGIPYVRVDVAQPRGEPREPRFLKLNPIGKVPALLLEDGDVLTESGAILFHFAQGTPLWPESLREQTEVLRWMFFEQYSHEPSLAVMRYLRLWTPMTETTQQRLAELEPKARHCLAVMDARLAAQSFIATGVCTIADYALYPYTAWSSHAGIELADYSSVAAWLKRVENEPGFLPLMSDGAGETRTFEEYFGESDRCHGPA